MNMEKYSTFWWTGFVLAVLNWIIAAVYIPSTAGFFNLIVAVYVTYILVTWNEDNYYNGIDSSST